MPADLSIISAQVLFLRLTVPADLYKSGILLEVHGVRVRVHSLNLKGPERPQKVQRKSTSQNDGIPSKAAKADSPRDRQSHVHDPGGPSTRESAKIHQDYHSDDKDSLPTTIDLAKSFLQQESSETREELQATIAESENMDKSNLTVESEQGDDAVGVGDTSLLPNFLAGYIKAVGDRTRVKIKDVEIDLQLGIDGSMEGSNASYAPPRHEDVTIRVTVEEVAVDGISNSIVEDEESKLFNKGVETRIQATRRIDLNRLGVVLVAEAPLFANFARPNTSSSPKSTNTSPVVKFHEDTTSSPDLTSSSIPDAGFPRQSTHSRPLLNKVQASASPRPFASDSLLETTQVPQDGVEEAMSIHTRKPEDLYHDSSAANSLYFYDDTKEGLPELSNKSNLSPLDASLSNLVDLRQMSPQADPFHNSPTFGAGSSGSSSSSLLEDLAKSKYFTHEEASLYMSAVSHESDRGRQNPPGNSNMSTSYTEDTNAAKVMPIPQDVPSSRDHDFASQETSRRSQGSHEQVDAATLDSYKIPKSMRSEDLRSGEREGHLPKPSTDPKTSSILDKEEVTSARDSETSSLNTKSSFEVAKHIFAVNRLSFSIPVDSFEPVNNSTSQKDSHGPKQSSMPGDYMHFSDTTATEPEIRKPRFMEASPHPTSSPGYSVDIESVQISSDMGLLRLMILIRQQLAIPFGSAGGRAESRKTPLNASHGSSNVRLNVAEVCWKFLDTVKGLPVASKASGHADPETGTESSEVLLRADVKRVNVAYQLSHGVSSVTTSIGNLSFGYCADPILSFDAELKMRESTRDILAPDDNDIVLTARHRKGVTEFKLTTLPLHIALDLQRLDETLSWLGGFSSMLDLGNSMMSTMTLRDKRPKHTSGDKSRIVRFADSSPPRRTQHDDHSPSQNKLTARLGGIVIDLEGRESAMQVETTAMKLVSREEGLGLQVDRLNLNGPFPGKGVDSLKAPMKIKITNIRVEYLPTPKEIDLTRLLALLSPSKERSAGDDDILLDTLLRQRSQGGVIRATIESLEGQVCDLGDLQRFSTLADDLKKLSTVTKYLPEDDRPGILTLGLIKMVQIEVRLNDNLGIGKIAATRLEVAHVSFPHLIAISVNDSSVHRNTEELIGEAFPVDMNPDARLPMIMARFIGNELEPMAKIRIYAMRVEYHVSTVMAMLGLKDSPTGEAVVAGLLSSVVMATSCHLPDTPRRRSPGLCSPPNETTSHSIRSVGVDVVVKDSTIGLNPRGIAAKGLLVLTDTQLSAKVPSDEQTDMTVDMKKAAIMIIDNVNSINGAHETEQENPRFLGSQLDYLTKIGYVTIGHISAAKASIHAIGKEDERQVFDVDIEKNLLILETCADSTHTFQDILNRLKPPLPPSTELKYRTEIVPIEDMLASLTGSVYVAEETREDNNGISTIFGASNTVEEDISQDLGIENSFFNLEPDEVDDGNADSMLAEDLGALASPSLTRGSVTGSTVQGSYDQKRMAMEDTSLDFREDHFGATPTIGGTAHRWNATSNTYDLSSEVRLKDSSLNLRLRDVHVIWNLFDGYDWQNTRDILSQAVDNVQIKVNERASRRDKRKSVDIEDEDESTIGDFLFNSVYIGIPAHRDPNQLANQVNRNIDDFASETESHGTSTSSASPHKRSASEQGGRRLRLKRSHHHKMTFELKGISADWIVSPPGSSETESSIDIRIQDLEIFDHVPSSTWKKFATYMHDAGERESGTSMLHIEILNVKPVPNLAASEVILKVGWYLLAYQYILMIL